MKPETIRLKEPFPFLGEGGKDPTIEVYLPHREQPGKRPVAVILPGGAYLFCSEREQEPVAVHLLPEGYAVFVLRYSVVPHRFPAQLREVAAVFELIRRHEEWQCDLSRSVLMGFSAGGHLAALYANAYAWQEVRACFPASVKPARSALCYPVISADPAIAHRKSFAFLLGHEPSDQERERFSCEKLVTPDTPPAFLWHTSQDENVKVANSLVYAAALARCGVPFELHIFPYGVHGTATADLQTNRTVAPETAGNSRWLTALKNWLKSEWTKEE